MTVDLPYPHKALWPNGRPHHMTKAREVKKHRAWAYQAATGEGRQAFAPDDFPLAVKIIVGGKSRGSLPDQDNVSAAAKSYLDGIADWIAVDDRNFAAPTIEFSPLRNSRFVIEISAPN